MNIKKIVLSSLLLAIGLMLHQIMPPIFFGMKPDMLLVMMFIAIVLNDDYKMTVIIGIAAGLLTAATTTFPGGQLPNIIDKIITSQVIYLLYNGIKNRFSNRIGISLLSALGTLISGTIFLTSALLIVGLPVSFQALIISVVLPAALVNTVFSTIIFNALNSALKYSTR